MRALALLALLAVGAAAPADELARARAAAQAAAARAADLARDAEGERGEAARARADEAAVAARIVATEADIRAAEGRVAVASAALAAQTAELEARRAPIVRLVAALQSFARTPAAAAIVQPGTLDAAVRVRATIGAVTPAIRARTAGIRAALARTAALRGAAAAALGDLSAARARLQAERLALVRLEADHRARGAALDTTALVESDRALALGERARDLVESASAAADAQATARRLAAIAAPLPRPTALSDAAERPQRAFGVAPYRLPVRGRVTGGMGELSGAGVRARGITLAASPGAAVTAPAAGAVVYARAFRDYGTVVIVDHGEGWSSAITGLAPATAPAGGRVTAGAPLGRVGPGGAVTVELRRRGRPVDLAQLIG